MMPHRLGSALAVAAVAAVAALAPSAAVRAASLQAIPDASGGTIVTAALPGATSPDGAFRAGLRQMDGYFSRSLALRSVVRSNDGSLTMGVFSATRGGARVSGLVLASYRGGTSQVAALYENAASFPHAMPKLVARLQTLPPPAQPATASGGSGGGDIIAAMRAVPTTPMKSNDGTVSIALPRGWQLKKFGEGAFVADGPDGAEVLRGVTFPLLDPRIGNPASGLGAPLPYSSDPAEAYRSFTMMMARSGNTSLAFTSIHEKPVSAPSGIHGAEVYGTSVEGGRALRFDQVVGVGTPGRMGAYTIVLNGSVAPADRFERDEPEMGALLSSYQMDNDARRQQVQQQIAAGWAASEAGRRNLAATTARDQAVVDASMANARAVQDGIDRSTAGFVRYLNDSDVVRTPSGAHVDVDRGTSDALRSFDPEHYSSVPVSQYVKGVDY